MIGTNLGVQGYVERRQLV